MSGPVGQTDGCCTVSPPKTRRMNVGEHLDQQIANARRQLEVCCVAKAKADAMGWLEHPIDDLTRIIYPNSGPF